MGAPGEDPKLDAKFVKLWAASTTSALGSGLVTVAAPLYVAARTSNPLMISSITVVIWIPWLLFTLPGGVLVDRVDRRRLMIALDRSRFVVMAGLGVLILVGHAGLWVLFTALFLIESGEVLFRSASSAMIPAVVPHQLLERANGWLMGGAVTTQQMIAGPLGGFLFVVAASIPFLANAGTYAVSAVLTALIPGTYRAVTRQHTVGVAEDAETAQPRGLASIRADLAESFRFLMGQRILRTMAILIGVLNVTLTAALAVLVLLAKQRLHLGSVGYGLLFTALAVGGVLGSSLGDRLVKRVTATWTIRVGLIIEALTHLVLAASSNPYLVGFAMFAFGIHAALWTMVGSSLRQRLTPPDMMGRSASLNLFIAFGGNAIGAVLGGVLAKRFGITAPYWVAFVVAAIVAASTWHVFSRAEVAKAYQTPPHLLLGDDPASVTEAARA
jgi:MFS family permease